MRIQWMNGHQTQADVDQGRVAHHDLFGNSQADIVANVGTAEHPPLHPTTTWTYWTACEVFFFCLFPRRLSSSTLTCLRCVTKLTCNA
eukprot:6367408-Amphidinium_carterae.1